MKEKKNKVEDPRKVVRVLLKDVLQPIVMVVAIAESYLDGGLSSVLAIVAGTATALLICVSIFMLAATYRSWQKMHHMYKLQQYVLHLEIFSMMLGQFIMPKGEMPTPESEVKRFQDWRFN